MENNLNLPESPESPIIKENNNNLETIRTPKKVLLIEPNYKTFFLPLGLAKISGYHKSLGDEVRFQKGSIMLLEQDYYPDIIYITSLFTWYIKEVQQSCYEAVTKYPNAKIKLGGISVSLLPSSFKKWEKNIEITIGSIKEFDESTPDFDLFKVDYLVAYTTKGCVNRCPYCMVHKLEPEFLEIKNWDTILKNIPREDLNLPKEKRKYKKIYFWDNNFLCSSIEHIKSVVEKIKPYKIEVDFNQGLDAERFDEERAKLLSTLKIHPLRFAYDNPRVEGHIQKAITLAIKYGIKDIAIYMLYNFYDKPEDIWHRLSEMAKFGNKVMVFLMKYQPLDTKNKSVYIGKFWDETRLKNILKIRNDEFINGILRFNNYYHFTKMFGTDESKFLELLNQKELDKTTKETIKNKSLNNYFN